MSINRIARPRAATARVLSIGIFASAATLGGCGGDPVEEEGGASFTAIYNASAFKQCPMCHAPGAPGRVKGIEATQDWSTRDKAYSTLKNGKASGLMDNFEACNGVPLIGATAEKSLVVAALDENVRENFATPSAPDCNGDTISDMTLKLGAAVPASQLANLKSWINAGAPNN